MGVVTAHPHLNQMKEYTDTKIKTKTVMSAVKIHGPNSPDVIAGRVPLGHQEPVLFEHPEQTVELTFDAAVEMFGREKAQELFHRYEERGELEGINGSAAS